MTWSATRAGIRQNTTLIVRILNPLMLISLVSSGRDRAVRARIGQDLVMAVIFYAYMIAAAFLYTRIRGFEKAERARQSLMIIFRNLGFMGIPLVRAMLGDQYIILLVIYLLGFNLLAYSYGIFMPMRMSPKKESFTIGRMFNAETIASVLSIVIFFFGIGFPAPVSSFLSSMGNMTVPLSMILIGVSLGNADLKALAGEKENYIFSAVDMVLIPLAAILFSRLIPVDPAVLVIFCLMVSMPVANLSASMRRQLP